MNYYPPFVIDDDGDDDDDSNKNGSDSVLVLLFVASVEIAVGSGCCRILCVCVVDE